MGVSKSFKIDIKWLIAMYEVRQTEQLNLLILYVAQYME